MHELDFNLDACIERWTEWYRYESDEDSALCCETYELSYPLYLKIIQHGYVNIDVASPMSDYSCFNGQTYTSTLYDTTPDDEYIPE